jgi:hypothetical protein
MFARQTLGSVGAIVLCGGCTILNKFDDIVPAAEGGAGMAGGEGRGGGLVTGTGGSAGSRVTSLGGGGGRAATGGAAGQNGFGEGGNADGGSVGEAVGGRPSGGVGGRPANVAGRGGNVTAEGGGPMGGRGDPAGAANTAGVAASSGGAVAVGGTTSSTGGAAVGGTATSGGAASIDGTAGAGATASGGQATSGGALGSGGGGGVSGAGGNSGSGVCSLGDRRSCADAGALGTCASGEQLCQADGSWGSCSIVPLARDSCAVDNDDDCDGLVNEGCLCLAGQPRLCSQGGYAGTCATGTQTCDTLGNWGPCSIPPAATDTCSPNNDDSCNNIVNEGCLCITNATRTCGDCNDGSQTCTDGKLGTWSDCTLGTQRVTYYRDQDGDGHGSPTLTTTVCGAAPAGYIAGPADDCCDLDANAYTGQTSFFQVANACGDFDYDCNGEEEKQTSGLGIPICPVNCVAGASTPCIWPAWPACGIQVDLQILAWVGTPINGCVQSSGKGPELPCR